MPNRRPNETAADLFLNARVRSWKGTLIPRGSIEVVASNPGQWSPTQHCQAPKLWLLLSGYYQAFHWAQHGLHAMAKHSSDGCFMVAAAVPETICVPSSSRAHGSACARHPLWAASAPWQHLDWRLFARAVDEVPALLRRASRDTFGGRLAFVVVRGAEKPLRETSVASHGTIPLWHLAWSVAAWSSRRNGFQTPPHAVVIRTRPDAVFTAPFHIRPLMDFFRSGLHGLHVVLTQNSIDPAAQSDSFLVTSWACYANDIARPLEHQLSRQRAIDAGMGASYPTVRRRDHCLCLTNYSSPAAECDTPPSCVPITMESPFVLPVGSPGEMMTHGGLLHSAPQACCLTPETYSAPQQLTFSIGLIRYGLWFNASHRIELDQNVRCFCSVDHSDESGGPSPTETAGAPWLVQRLFRRCVEAQPLAQLPAPWCACGPKFGFNGKTDVSCTKRTNSHHGMWRRSRLAGTEPSGANAPQRRGKKLREDPAHQRQHLPGAPPGVTPPQAPPDPIRRPHVRRLPRPLPANVPVATSLSVFFLASVTLRATRGASWWVVFAVGVLLGALAMEVLLRRHAL